MSVFEFHKYQGAGNDFIMMDARETGDGNFTNTLVRRLCDRRFGIGADGLILLLHSTEKDFYMKYFNSDGYEGSMCGNGGRCIVAFAGKLGIVSNAAVFEGIDGDHSAHILEDGQIKLKMIDVKDIIPLPYGYFLNTGSPHLVILKGAIDNLEVVGEGRKYRYDPEFSPGGTNVNFVKIMDKDKIAIRTYERGVEDETLACGTGSVASAIISHIINKTDKGSHIVHTKGGTLQVDFQQNGNNYFHDIWLTGPAEFVFKGEIDINPL